LEFGFIKNSLLRISSCTFTCQDDTAIYLSGCAYSGGIDVVPSESSSSL